MSPVATRRRTGTLQAYALALIVLSGCGDDSGGSGETGPVTGDPGPEVTGVCANLAAPCEEVRSNSAGTVITCALSTKTCGVDLSQVVSQVQFGVTEQSVLWIQAWGADGGNSDEGCMGGTGGYAQTTTSVGDLRSMNTGGSAQMYYFLADRGGGGGKHCGAAGGSATIVTLTDLTAQPGQGPSLAAPPTLLVAGGGGGRRRVEQQ